MIWDLKLGDMNFPLEVSVSVQCRRLCTVTQGSSAWPTSKIIIFFNVLANTHRQEEKGMHLPEKQREKGTLQRQLFPALMMLLKGTGEAEKRPQKILWIYYTFLLSNAAGKKHIKVPF